MFVAVAMYGGASRLVLQEEYRWPLHLTVLANLPMLSPKDLMASPMYGRQKLVQEGWVYVDDDDYRIEFSQDWAVTRSSPQAYENSMHVVSLQGATATFVFAGT